MRKINPEVKVIEDAPVEVLASSILKVSEAAKRLEASGLNRRALVVLLKAQSGVDYTTIERVLQALPRLAETYLTTKS